jgi:hypothetical protein
MARQPNRSATMPLIVRESRMPTRTPEAMVPREQHLPVRCRGGASQSEAGSAEDGGDEPAPVQQVPERHQEEDPDRVADLSDSDQQAGHRRGDAERAGDLLQQRLRPVQVADRGAAGHGEQQRPAARHGGRRSGATR